MNFVYVMIELEDENHFVCRCTKYFILTHHVHTIVSRNNVKFISMSDKDKLNCPSTLGWHIRTIDICYKVKQPQSGDLCGNITE